MTTTSNPQSFVLAPGHWLGAWAWDDVAAELERRGHRVTAVTLPGLDPDDAERTSRTLAEQAATLQAAVGAAGERPVLVAHSGAGYPTSLLLNDDPGAAARVVYVDSGPSSDGGAFDDSVPADVAAVALPPFEELVASLDGLSEADLARFRERAVPEPAGIMREHVQLANDARRDVPTTIICCSFTAEQTMELARAGNPMMAEVAELRNLELVDLPTGHWPMWSRPVDLAAALEEAAGR